MIDFIYIYLSIYFCSGSITVVLPHLAQPRGLRTCEAAERAAVDEDEEAVGFTPLAACASCLAMISAARLLTSWFCAMSARTASDRACAAAATTAGSIACAAAGVADDEEFDEDDIQSRVSVYE